MKYLLCWTGASSALKSSSLQSIVVQWRICSVSLKLYRISFVTPNTQYLVSRFIQNSPDGKGGQYWTISHSIALLRDGPMRREAAYHRVSCSHLPTCHQSVLSTHSHLLLRGRVLSNSLTLCHTWYLVSESNSHVHHLVLRNSLVLGRGDALLSSPVQSSYHQLCFRLLNPLL